MCKGHAMKRSCSIAEAVKENLRGCSRVIAGLVAGFIAFSAADSSAQEIHDAGGSPCGVFGQDRHPITGLRGYFASSAGPIPAALSPQALMGEYELRKGVKIRVETYISALAGANVNFGLLNDRNSALASTPVAGAWEAAQQAAVWIGEHRRAIGTVGATPLVFATGTEPQTIVVPATRTYSVYVQRSMRLADIGIGGVNMNNLIVIFQCLAEDVNFESAKFIIDDARRRIAFRASQRASDLINRGSKLASQTMISWRRGLRRPSRRMMRRPPSARLASNAVLSDSLASDDNPWEGRELALFDSSAANQSQNGPSHMAAMNQDGLYGVDSLYGTNFSEQGDVQDLVKLGKPVASQMQRRANRALGALGYSTRVLIDLDGSLIMDDRTGKVRSGRAASVTAGMIQRSGNAFFGGLVNVDYTELPFYARRGEAHGTTYTFSPMAGVALFDGLTAYLQAGYGFGSHTLDFQSASTVNPVRQSSMGSSSWYVGSGLRGMFGAGGFWASPSLNAVYSNTSFESVNISGLGDFSDEQIAYGKIVGGGEIGYDILTSRRWGTFVSPFLEAFTTFTFLSPGKSDQVYADGRQPHRTFRPAGTTVSVGAGAEYTGAGMGLKIGGRYDGIGQNKVRSLSANARMNVDF